MGESIVVLVVAHRKPLRHAPLAVADQQRCAAAQEFHRCHGRVGRHDLQFLHEPRRFLVADIEKAHMPAGADDIELLLIDIERDERHVLCDRCDFHLRGFETRFILD